MTTKSIAAIILASVFGLSGCGNKNMIDADKLTLKLKNELGATRIEEKWNGTLVLVNYSEQEFGTIESIVKTAFADISHDFDDDSMYEKPHFSIHAMSPETDSAKKHRWQINVHDVTDEEALDDMGSYLAKDLEALAKPKDKFIIVIFDNGSKYAE